MVEKKKNIMRATCSEDNLSMMRNSILTCEVMISGHVEINNYLQFSNRLDRTKLSPKDIIDLSKLDELDISYISCVTDNPEHLIDIREMTSHFKNKVKILSKIECERAIVNIDSILENSDGIIIESGAISSIVIEELYLIEMLISEKCRLRNKLFIFETFAKSNINIIEYSARTGVDALMLNNENSEINYTHLRKNFTNNLIDLEAIEDTKDKYEEVSK
jgi:hypothetical protein